MTITIRRNCKDIWNAFMVKGATFPKNDIPICPITAKEVPNEVVSYRTAKSICSKETRRNPCFKNMTDLRLEAYKNVQGK